MTTREAEQFERAYGLHAEGALDEAETIYLAILAAIPEHADARHQLGVLRFQRGRPEEGIALMTQALRDAPGARRFNELGNVHAQLGEPREAAQAYRSAIRLSPADANLWNNLGSVLHRLGEAQEAEAAYRQAIRVNPQFVPALLNLALLLGEEGREDESTLFHARAFVQPPFEGKSLRTLGVAHCRLGDARRAADCYRRWLQEDPANPEALHHLAACGGADVPERASDEYVAALFDAMAEKFDEKLVVGLGYRGPAIIEELLQGQVAADARLDILDAGCGTGLCMPVLAPMARRLVGVDLSEAMLRRARERGGYDELVQRELTAYLDSRAGDFDLVVMTDTLIYFGDLAPVLGAVARALRPGGLFAFTVEEASGVADAGPEYVLRTTGRYAHDRAGLLLRLRSAGFDIRRSAEVVLRRELGAPVDGIALLASATRR